MTILDVASEVFEDGYGAALTGLSLVDNPCPDEHADEFIWWNNGWYAGRAKMKQDATRAE